MPMIKKIRQITRNRKKRNLAIPAAATAMPVNPNNAATSAITKKITAQRNMFYLLKDESGQHVVARVNPDEAGHDLMHGAR